MISVYVNDIQNALKNHCYFSALSLALTLPDICGMAEYPSSPVTDRYIKWFDKYIGESVSRSEHTESPYLSGEMVYNLRNTYLHQGSPNVISSKVREERNQIDKFMLVLGDGTQIQKMTFTVDVGMGKAVFRSIMIDVTFLCNSICDSALWYYQNHKEKFSFDFTVLPQTWLYGKESPLDSIVPNSDPIGDAINQKLKKSDSQVRMIGNLTEHVMNLSARTLAKELAPQNSQESTQIVGIVLEEPSVPMKQKIKLNDQKKNEQKKNKPKITEQKKNEQKKKSGKEKPQHVLSKREQQLRCFFGENFKEKKYKSNRETIITAVLEAGTKTALNNTLMRYFPGEDVKEIYKRLKPFLKEMPGN